MKIIEQSYKIINNPTEVLQHIEAAGRTCYKSEDKITADSASKFVRTLVKSGHHAMIEFDNMTVRFITNRGVTHEIVRHRLCSFAQESTRYVKYNGDMEFIKPIWYDNNSDMPNKIFRLACEQAEFAYKGLLKNNWQPQQAREVLPNSLKTEIVVSANMREWRHIFKLRSSPKAHPQMQALIQPLYKECLAEWPELFENL